jgi:riboflavin kinase/FMN adenylyltransferase
VQHYRSISDVNLEGSWLTIGSFDGVHLGHQEIIRGLTTGAHAAATLAVVLTFHPHPAAVLRQRHDAFYLTTPEERAEILGSLGVDVIITQPFNQHTAATSARSFINALSTHLKLQQLWVGYDFALGRDREGDINTLRSLGELFNYQVHLVPPVEVNGQVISSSGIRNLLADGHVDQARYLLGRPYQIRGSVVHGDGRGYKIGIPTANLVVDEVKLLPGVGVYACWAEVDGRRWPAATNIGVRPTFDGRSVLPHVEAHLIEFDGDLYGQQVKLEFMAYLRGEQRFPGIDALVAQIRHDIQRVRELIVVHQ